MRRVTGIELGANWCVLVSARPAADAVEISAVHGVEEAQRYGPEALDSRHLAGLRRSHLFPRHAHVVAWQLPEGARPDGPSARAAVAPLVEAGFAVDVVISAPEALTALARRYPPSTGAQAAAWIALNRHAAAIAIVDSGTRLYAKTFEWTYREGATARDALLRRLLLVAHLAPEVQHGIDAVRARHGVAVDCVLTCGDLPELRALTMPLIEELDVEVETLDSPVGLAFGPAARMGAAPSEQVPVLRLASAAAAVEHGRTGWFPLPARAAAALAAAAVGIWGAAALRPDTTDAGAGSQEEVPAGTPAQAAPARTADVPLPPPPALRDGALAPNRADRLPSAEDAPGVGVRPEATMGRDDASGGARAPVASSGGRSGPAAPPSPLAAPLPEVSLILASSERRLAVVEGAILREGDRVGPRVIERIEPGAVVLREPSGVRVRAPIRRRSGVER